MIAEELMKQLAELLGRALVRRWVEGNGQPWPFESTPDQPDPDQGKKAGRGRLGDSKKSRRSLEDEMQANFVPDASIELQRGPGLAVREVNERSRQP